MPRQGKRGDVLNAIRGADERVLSAPEIADRAGVSKPTAYNHLDTLQDEGEVNARDMGQMTVYWPAESEPPGQVTEQAGGRERFEERQQDRESGQHDDSPESSEGWLDKLSLQDESVGIGDKLVGADRWMIGLALSAFAVVALIAVAGVVFGPTAAPVVYLGAFLGALVLMFLSALAGALFAFGLVVRYGGQLGQKMNLGVEQ